MIENSDYRLVLILPYSRQLLGMRSLVTTELPVFSIPMWERPAEALTKQIEGRWNIRTIILDIFAGAGSKAPCAVAEVRTGSWNFESEGLSAARLEDIGDLSLTESERRSLERILIRDDEDVGAFARIGWIEGAQRWIQSCINDHEVIFTDDIRQLNGGGTFCLLRFATQSGPAYWMKGVGEPNAHEFAVTSYLATHSPEYLPPIVAMRSDWNAWVMEEFGSSLHNSDSLADFERAVCRLADLQKKFAGRSEELLAAKCADHRTEVLSSHIDEIIDYLDDAMRRQASTKVSPLSTSRLHEIRAVLHTSCQALQALLIPDSLIHNDISPGSILDNGTACVFTDWCEGYVGNPFITLEQLCEHVARKTDQPVSWVRSLRNVYKSRWQDVLTEPQIEGALQLTPLISVLSYLYGRGDWLHTARRNEPAFLSYSRSLARHMDRIVTRIELSEPLCQPS
jgi:hypothetical protein